MELNTEVFHHVIISNEVGRCVCWPVKYVADLQIAIRVACDEFALELAQTPLQASHKQKATRGNLIEETDISYSSWALLIVKNLSPTLGMLFFQNFYASITIFNHPPYAYTMS